MRLYRVFTLVVCTHLYSIFTLVSCIHICTIYSRFFRIYTLISCMVILHFSVQHDHCHLLICSRTKYSQRTACLVSSKVTVYTYICICIWTCTYIHIYCIFELSRRSVPSKPKFERDERSSSGLCEISNEVSEKA